MIKLVINPELRDYLPPLTDAECESLHLMLTRDGIRDSIKYWMNPDTEKAEIIDGHNRYAWAQKNGKPYKEECISFPRPTLANVKLWMLKNQEGRRGGGTFAKTIEIVKLEAEAEGLPEPPPKEIRDEVMKRTGASRQATERKLAGKVDKTSNELTELLKLLKQKLSNPESLERFKSFLESL